MKLCFFGKTQLSGSIQTPADTPPRYPFPKAESCIKNHHEKEKKMQKNYKLISRKELILQEAARLFHEKGYKGTTLRELAKFSGVKGGSIYHHFSSKQEILCHIMEKTMKTLIEGVREAISPETSPYEKLRKAIRFHIEFHTQAVSETYVTDSELHSLEPENYQKIVNLRDEYEKLYISIMQSGTEAGQLNIENVELATKGLMQMCTGVSYWYRPDGSLSTAEIADNYIDIFFWGVVGKKEG